MLMKKSDGKEIRSYIDKAIKKYIERDSYKLARKSIKDTIEHAILGECYTEIRQNVSNLMAGLYDSRLDNKLMLLIRKHLPTNIIYVSEYKDPPPALKPLNVKQFMISPTTSGIYFLCRNNRIVYIGQATNLSKRIPSNVGK